MCQDQVQIALHQSGTVPHDRRWSTSRRCWPCRHLAAERAQTRLARRGLFEPSVACLEYRSDGRSGQVSVGQCGSDDGLGAAGAVTGQDDRHPAVRTFVVHRQGDEAQIRPRSRVPQRLKRGACRRSCWRGPACRQVRLPATGPTAVLDRHGHIHAILMGRDGHRVEEWSLHAAPEAVHPGQRDPRDPVTPARAEAVTVDTSRRARCPEPG